MFLRRLMIRPSCPNFSSNERTIPSASRLTHEDFSNCIHHNSSCRNVSFSGHSSDACPLISCDLERLLSVDSRYSLYEFLRFFVVSDKIHCIIKRMVEVPERELAFPQVLNLVNMYSWNQRREGIDMMRRCAAQKYTKELEAHGNFEPHKILCDNLNEPIRALDKLHDMTSDRAYLKSVILAQAELLLSWVTSRGSQSVVDKVNKYLVSDCSAELRGPLLCSSWVSLYLSPYEDDQIRAANILRTNERAMLPHLEKALSSVAQHLLSRRQLNRYYVLLQHFSQRSHKAKTRELVEKLFYYFYATNNLRGCLACESLARELHLELPQDVKYKCNVIKMTRIASSNRLDMKFIF